MHKNPVPRNWGEKPKSLLRFKKIDVMNFIEKHYDN